MNEAIPARDSAARCAMCARRGTWAFLVSARGELTRYCWRCWPRAHQQSLVDEQRDLVQFFASTRGEARSLLGTESAPSEGELQLRAGWHWILGFGTRRRLRRHLQEVRNIAHGAAT